VFATFTTTDQETNTVFLFKSDDWIGQYVFLLNPVYKGDITKKKDKFYHLMTVGLSEMLLPIRTHELQHLSNMGLVSVHTSFDRQRPVNGGNAFCIRTNKIRIVDTSSHDDACGNALCNARHQHGTKCVFPNNNGRCEPIINYSAKVLFPEYPKLEEVDICCASFSRIFCDQDYLANPSQMKRYKKSAWQRVLDRALHFYEHNDVYFEIVGVGYGLLSSEGNPDNEVPYVSKVKAFQFVVDSKNGKTFDDKLRLELPQTIINDAGGGEEDVGGQDATSTFGDNDEPLQQDHTGSHRRPSARLGTPPGSPTDGQGSQAGVNFGVRDQVLHPSQDSDAGSRATSWGGGDDAQRRARQGNDRPTPNTDNCEKTGGDGKQDKGRPSGKSSRRAGGPASMRKGKKVEGGSMASRVGGDIGGKDHTSRQPTGTAGTVGGTSRARKQGGRSHPPGPKRKRARKGNVCDGNQATGASGVADNYS
jgi:hypothetical protein